MSNQDSISSPISTGGAGHFFEQHVGAQFLALLLVKGIPPILKNCQVEQVHFQTEHLGWNTDDLLVIGKESEGQNRKLVAQIKRNFTISSNNDSCRKAFCDFWKDFNNNKFNPTHDRLALITLRGTNTLLDKFASLLDCARASANESDFRNRLSQDGFISKKARKQTKVIETIIEDEFDEPPEPSSFWKFLRTLFVVSYDLNTESAQQETWIKTLLAQTSSEPDSVASAESTWLKLLQLAGGADGIPAAGSYYYKDLPQNLRTRHSALASRPGGQLQELIDHSSVTLEGIDTTIDGSVEISRDSLELEAINLLDEAQATIITGPAGYGKSVIAKNVIKHLQESYFCLAFRSEEFSHSHLDQSLKEIQESLTTKRLSSIFSGQGKKVILIESVERLLESSQRKAFMDLLRLSKRDKSLRLILTCRDYSLETVKMSLLEHIPVQYKVLSIPPFNDQELEQVSDKIDSLSIALKNPSLKKLLRSPYFLKIAARIKWSEYQSVPKSEREFRNRCWSEVIRSDINTAEGLSRKRGEVFQALALRRAKKLKPFVKCEDLDSSTIEALRKDDLISYSNQSYALAAPAHDVLEDWAVINWLNDRYAINEGDSHAIADEISGYPSLRRGYRKWLDEMLKVEFEKAEEFILSAFQDDTLPSYFRDDTIICTLLSPTAEEFLNKNLDNLLKNEGDLLIRVIHLLRVACKRTPSWLNGNSGFNSQFLIPTGDAWGPVLEIICNELDTLVQNHFKIILGLVEDWSQQISYWNPKADGYKEAGKIIARLLEDLGGYNTSDLRERALKVFAKIPESNPDAFKNLLKRGGVGKREDRVATDFAELLLTKSNCSFACKYFPKEIVELAMSYFCLSEEDVQEARENLRRTSLGTTEPHFGIDEKVDHSFSVPSSAIRGPFYPLLQYHPVTGVEFITQFINHACSWYAEGKLSNKPQSPAQQTKLKIYGEDHKVNHWINSRLYGMYRGVTNTPYVLQSALMALEKWLLEIAEFDKIDLEGWLLKLLKDSNNIAITAVVASVCVAKTEKCGTVPLTLLSNRDLVRIDRARMARDHMNTSISAHIPSIDPMKKIYDEERKESDALPHRNKDLESIAIKLQLSEMREEIWEIIDEHRKALPPQEKQSEEDRLWRLALHRIDMRGFEVGEEIPAEDIENNSSDSDDGEEQRYFQLIPSQLESDVQKISDQAAEDFEEQASKLSLVNWARAAWKGNLDEDSKSWQELLSLAKDKESTHTDNHQVVDSYFDFTDGGPGFVAAVCVRYHWTEMTPNDRSWCKQQLIQSVKKNENNDDLLTQESRGALTPDRYAAFSLSRIIQKDGIENTDESVISTLAIALTHSTHEVREFAAEGLGYHSEEVNEEFIMRCLGALAKKGRIVKEKQNQESEKPFQERTRRPELVKSVIPEIRQNIISGNFDPKNELRNVNPLEWSYSSNTKLILRILGYQKDSEIALSFFKKITSSFTEKWKENKQNRFSSGQRNYEFEFWCAERIARYALKVGVDQALSIYEPIYQSVEEYPKEVAEFVKQLILEEDRLDRDTPFWEIWQVFADTISETEWIDKLDANYVMARDGKKLLKILLLGIQWKQNIRSWYRLKNQEYRIENLIKQVPPTSASIMFYCRFLYHIGKEALPESFKTVADQLKSISTSQALSESNTIYYLESLLRRYVYGEPLLLKEDPQVRESVLYILDQLVESGSSAAYLMRDDFVTPISSDSA